jgi:hypothetical protein
MPEPSQVPHRHTGHLCDLRRHPDQEVRHVGGCGLSLAASPSPYYLERSSWRDTRQLSHRSVSGRSTPSSSLRSQSRDEARVEPIRSKLEAGVSAESKRLGLSGSRSQPNFRREYLSTRLGAEPRRMKNPSERGGRKKRCPPRPAEPRQDDLLYQSFKRRYGC